MRNIGVFTGSRANYSSTKTILRGLQDSKKVNLVSILGGAASLSRYGAIGELMVADGLLKPHFEFNMFIDGEHTSDMAKSCGLGIVEMSTILRNSSLAGLVVIGDRYDVLAAATAAALMNIPLIHTMGGELSGTIDESIRHAITKFAHLHLVASEDAAMRVVKLGERPESVKCVGCPRMDLVKEAIESDSLETDNFYRRYSGVGPNVDVDSDFLLVSYHPVTSEIDDMRRQVGELLAALGKIKLPTIMLWPNFDGGSSQVAKAIRTYRELNHPDWLHISTNFSVEDYSRLMARTRCLIGNSSSGIREGAFIGTPVVNVGSRQNGRERAKNVIDCQADVNEIISAIQSQINHGPYDRSFIYGDGATGNRITAILEDFGVGNTQKLLNY